MVDLSRIVEVVPYCVDAVVRLVFGLRVDVAAERIHPRVHRLEPALPSLSPRRSVGVLSRHPSSPRRSQPPSSGAILRHMARRRSGCTGRGSSTATATPSPSSTAGRYADSHQAVLGLTPLLPSHEAEEGYGAGNPRGGDGAHDDARRRAGRYATAIVGSYLRLVGRVDSRGRRYRHSLDSYRATGSNGGDGYGRGRRIGVGLWRLRSQFLCSFVLVMRSSFGTAIAADNEKQLEARAGHTEAVESSESGMGNVTVSCTVCVWNCVVRMAGGGACW